MSSRRWAPAPDLPTTDEAGVPGIQIAVWTGLWAPKGTPRDIVMKLSSAVRETLTDPVVRQRVADVGYDIPPAEQLTPQALAAYHKSETEKWWPIIKAANIKVE
jgi:tripartite-type tricarboxylate transporter receptor subunit TctC